MQLRRPYFLAALLLCLVAASCAPAPTLNPVASPVAQSTLTPVVPDTGLFAGQPAGSPAQPVMALGSAFRYFDGSLLDAVPDNGPFLMGLPNSYADNPQHKISVSPFWIYSTEVTNQMYAWCVSLGKCTPPNAGDDPLFQNIATLNYPVVGVTWQQASDYCSFAHGRLPTEAEWEKAATWDAVNKLQSQYPWGNQAPDCSLLNFKYCVGHATSVVQYGQGRSFYGAYNMEGNVSEWVQDWYSPNYYSTSPAQDPAGPSSGTMRVIRGSAYDSDAVYASPAARLSSPPTSHRNDLGFRCAVQDPSYYAPFCTVPASFGFSAFVPGSSSQCPDPAIQHLEGCTLDSQPVDFVTILNSGQTAVTVTGLEKCSPGNNDVGVQHTCPAGVTITVAASCGTNPAGSPSCPPNYRQDPKDPLKCTPLGAPGSCPAGFTYDSSVQCCTAAPNSSASVPLCSVGQRAFDGKCVDDATGPQAPASLTYVTGGISCTQVSYGGGVGPTQIIPVPTNPPHPTVVPTNAPRPTPVPTNAPPGPHPGNGGGGCKHNKHGCPGGSEGFFQFLASLFSLFF